MSRPFLSRPAVRRFLATSGVVVIYGALALFFAWVAWHVGCQSSTSVVSGFLSFFCALIAAREVQYFRTGHY